MDNNKPKGSRPLILVVDDELVGRIYIENALQQEGYDVITAENGHQALELMSKKAPTLIVMDVMMPIIDGYAACRAIREKEQGIHIPIIMLTGLDDLESVEKSYRAGATDFVVKPVNLPIFYQRVQYGIATYERDVDFYKQQQRLLQAHSVAKLGYWEWNFETEELYWSDDIFKMLSVPMNNLKPQLEDMWNWVHPDDREKVQLEFKNSIKKGGVYSIEHQILRSDKKIQVVSQHAELIKNESGRVVRMQGIVQDITEKFLSQKEIHYLAYYDSLTDLPNRIFFCEHLKRSLSAIDSHSGEVAVFIIEPDRFKNINNALGHEVGDEFLKNIATCLKDTLGTHAHLGKFSGVKFSLFLDLSVSKSSTTDIANMLLRELSKEFDIHDNELMCTASIGAVISSPDNRQMELLLRQAERAMCESKDSGGNRFNLYSETMKSHAHQLLTTERELRNAVKNNELEVYYQPKCSVETGAILGMEALVRWNHPLKGLIPPNDFISVAEETGLIIPIGLQVLETACSQTVVWHKQGFKHLIISINVSVKQFHHKGFSNEVLEIVKNTGIAPHCVDLEITESCTMNSFEKAIRLLTKFRNNGLRISMDDFGTGFSSLSFLQKLPLDTLKVDREFIKNIGDNGKNGELAKLIIAVAKELKLNVVAEGVETIEHLNFLKDNNCNEFQGYLTSPALPAKQFETLLTTQQ